MDVRLLLTCVVIVGGAIGLALPVFEANKQLTHESNNAESGNLTIAAVQPATVSGWGDELTIPRETDGHFYADVSIDGVPMRMLVDTGASVIALTGEDALAMGLYWDESDVVPVAQGAGGPVHGVNTTLPRVRMGEFVATDVRAIIVPEGLGISLLGQSFLQTIGNVRIADDRMVLGG